MSRLGKQAMMERLGATLTNVRWSWDATTPDGSIIFIRWEHEAVRNADGQLTECLLALSLEMDGKGPGARERIRHIEELLATRAVGYLVLATAKDPDAHPREIEYITEELYSVRLEQRGAAVYGVVIAANSDLYIHKHREIEADAEEALVRDAAVSATEKEELIRARRGQGRFRAQVEYIEAGCRVTGIRDRAHLRAGHIKPWRLSTNVERLDGNNGLLLAPHIDHLFDRGYISFSDDGRLLVANDLDPKLLAAWGVDPGASVGDFNPQQREYLAFHRAEVFRSDRRTSGHRLTTRTVR